MDKIYRQYGTDVPNFVVDMTDLCYIGLGKNKVVLLFKSKEKLFDINTKDEASAFKVYDALSLAWMSMDELN